MATKKENIVMRERDMQKVSSQQKVVQIAVKAGVYAFLFIMALIIVFPFYWMIISSLKTLTEYKQSVPTFWPQQVEFVEGEIPNYEGLTQVEGTEITKLSYKVDAGTYKITLPATDNANGIVITQITFRGEKNIPAITPNTLNDSAELQKLTIVDSINTWGDVSINQDMFVINKDAEGGIQITLNKDVTMEVHVKPADESAAAMLTVAHKELTVLDKWTPWLPMNYYEAFNTGNLGVAFLNTIIVGLVSTILSLIITVLSAFAFARLEFKGKETMFGLMLATMMIPGELFTITNYITVSSVDKLGATLGIEWIKGINSYWVLIIPFLVSVFYIFLLRQNFMQIPNELYLAAKVDGTSDIKYLWKVMIPLAMPTLISITILKMMGAWNTYIWPNLVTSDRNMYLITLAIRKADFSEEQIVNFPVQMAAVTLVSIPLFMVFIFLRKYIMAGVSRSGIKG